MTAPLNKTLIVIAGPNAVGKTAYAIEAAKHFNTEIVSCDSRQIFKEMTIGVGRPSSSELNQVKHHFIASHSIREEYNAGQYEREANLLLKQLFKTKDTVIMAGGTGLYIKAACFGLDLLPQRNRALREELKSIYDKEGIEGLQKRASSEGVNTKELDINNPQRIIRAIEINSSTAPPKPKIDRNYQVFLYYLNRPRETVYIRINKRVDRMLALGLEEEAKSLRESQHLNALQTVGYKEFFEYFNGGCTREEAIEKIKQNSRNYAKRQLTWFRNQGFKEIDADFPVSDLLSA